MSEYPARPRAIGIRQRSLVGRCRPGRATELVFVFATGAMLILPVGRAEAADLTWAPVSGPSDTWAPGDTDWLDETDTRVAFTSGDTLTFGPDIGGVPFTVTVATGGGGFDAGAMTVNTDADMTLAGAAPGEELSVTTLSVEDGSDLTNLIGLVVSGDAEIAGAFTNSGTYSSTGILNADGPVTNTGSMSVVEVVNTDTFINSGSLTGAFENDATLDNSGDIDGAVDNDGTLTASGGSLGSLDNGTSGDADLNGTDVVGDLETAGALTLSGSVGGDLTQTGGTATVDGDTTVGGTTFVRGGTFTVESGTLTSDLNATNRADVVIDGTLAGDLNNINGIVDLSGTLDGDLENASRMNVVGPTATVTGSATNVGRLDVNGTLTTATVTNGTDGRLNVNGTLMGNVDNTGGLVVLAGTLDGDLDNDASARVAFVGASVTGAVTNSDTLRVNGTLTAATVVNETGGTLNLDGVVAGDVDNTGGTVLLDGEVTGALDNDGTVTVDGTGSVGGALTNRDTLTVTSGGNLTTDSVATEAGAETDVDGTMNGDVTGVAGSTIDISGGTVNGDVVTAGRLELGGDVNGAVTGTGFTLVDGASAVTGAVENGDTMRVAATLTASGGVENTVGSTLTVVAGGQIDGAVDNAGQVVLSGGGTGALINRVGATVDVIGAATQTGTLTNNGALDIADGGTLTFASGQLEGTGAATVESGGVLAGDTGMTGALVVEAGGRVTGTVTTDAGGAGSTDITGRVGGLTVAGAGATLGAGSGVDGSAQVDAGTLSVEGGTIGALNIASGATVDLNGDATVTGNLVNRGELTGDTTASSDLTLTVANVFTNDGTLSNDGTAGELTVDAGTIELTENSVVSGAVVLNGAITNSGTVIYDADTSLRGDLTNDATGNVQVAAEVDADGFNVTNSGRLDVQESQSLTNAGAITNDGTLTVGADAELEGDTITNEAGGLLTSTGTLTGEVTNEGRLEATGIIDGAVENDGVLIVDGDLTVARLETSGTTEITSGSGLSGGPITVTGGRFENAGVVDGPLRSQAGASVISTGTLAQGARLRGESELEGDVVGDLTNTATGDMILTGALGVTGTFTNVGELTGRGPLEVGGGLANRGTATLEAGLDGDLSNSGIANISGDVSGDLENTAGETVLTGPVSIGGDLDLTGGEVSASGPVTVGGGMNIAAGTVTARGTVDVEDTLAVTGGLLEAENVVAGSLDILGDADVTGAVSVDETAIVQAGGTLSADEISAGAMSNAGSVNATNIVGDFGNAEGGILEVSGNLTGDLTNQGDAEIGGIVDGDIGNAGTLFLGDGVDGDLTNATGGELSFGMGAFVTGTFLNGDDLTIAGGETLSVGRLTQAFGTLDLNGTLDGPLQVNDGAESALGTASRIVGDTVNNGLIMAEDGASIGGALSGSGTTSLANGETGDTLNVGSLDGDRMRLVFDLDLTDGGLPAGIQSDRIISSGAVSGTYVLSFNLLDGSGVPSDPVADIVLIDGAAGSEIAALIDPDSRLPNTARTVFTLEADVASGDLLLIDQINPAVGALAGNIALTQSLIGSLVNRPTSPFVVGLAGETEPVCTPGVWSRTAGGSAEATGESTDSRNTFDSSVDASYSGLQLGADYACFNGALGAFDLAFGGIAGFNTGNTTQKLFQLDSLGGGLSDAVDSVTDASFDQTYLGGYVTAARGPLVADLQLRAERTEYTFDNRAVSGLALGLTDQTLKLDAITLSGSVSRSYQLGERGWSVVPTAGFSVSDVSDGELEFDDGSTLSLDSYTSKLAFAGATLSRTQVAASGRSALNYFATGTYYQDFTDDLISTFNDVREPGIGEEISSTPLGSYGEVSLGMNYVRILDGKRGRQFSASARLDVRSSGNQESYGLTGQVRWQF